MIIMPVPVCTITRTITMITRTDTGAPEDEGIALLRLLRLASPMLPVGAYSYSQGLEWAIDAGVVRDEATAQRWIGDLLRFGCARFELPVWWRLHRAWSDGKANEAGRWNDIFVASRETSELREEALQMGRSLRDLLVGLEPSRSEAYSELLALEFPAYVTVAAFAAAAWRIPAQAALTAYCWAWAENQVLAAMKTVPLGQLAGQRLLLALEPGLQNAVRSAQDWEDDALANFVPGFALASALHESQYSRLFRS
jgi:urease accessory protein